MLNMVFQAAFDGDLPVLKRLVTKLDMGKGNPKEAVETLRVKDAGMLEGVGVLHIAACRGRLEVCRYLIEELRVDVNGVDKEGRTPLKFAIRCNSVVKYLLDHGADPDRASHDGISPLHDAARSGDCLTVELLLAKGAYVDPVAFCGTPLHCTATGDHDSTMKILLDHHADVGAESRGALTYAVKNLHSAKMVSSDFLDCILEDVGADCVISHDEPVAKRKIRAAGFKRLGNDAFKNKDYSSAEGSYSVVY